MSSVRVSVRPSDGRGDAVAAALFVAGAEALQELNGALVTHVETEEAASALGAAARAVDAAVVIDTEAAPEIDWSSAWKAQLRAHTVGYLTVTPPWLAAPFLPERRIIIEPAMAFGTGDHATTRGVLMLMQDEVRKGDIVADLGAGSAVLAIGAAKLGAARAAAIENDPDAIGNAEENVATNEVSHRVKVIEGDAAIVLPLVAPVRVVLANIISSVIRQLLPVIKRSLTADGAAIFSGMLVVERDEMIAAFAESGLEVRAEISEGEWWTAKVSAEVSAGVSAGVSAEVSALSKNSSSNN
jgi:ribosomal protein L11 methyltransferase